MIATSGKKRKKHGGTCAQLAFPFDSHAPRLSGQRLRILERLRRGPATNRELNAICLRFGSRLMELRDLGHQIRTIPIGHGVFQYELLEPSL
jgi:hypothetical protein